MVNGDGIENGKKKKNNNINNNSNNNWYNWQKNNFASENTFL